jgi:adenosylcobinamide kinase/adenosylcobinamide-phosphate guanylyltransferase
MGRQLTLILGGARSGKSTYAEQQAAATAGEVLYIATAEAWDDEMRQRIAAHRAQRPATWRTVEAPRQTGAAIRAALTPATTCVLVDCLTLLASNVHPGAAGSERRSRRHRRPQRRDRSAAGRLRTRATRTWCIVSNEVGLGIVPAYPLGRLYRDALGRANQRLAAAADCVLLMVAGLPMTVK